MINTKEIKARGYKFNVTDEAGQEVGRAFLYILINELHDQPFGFLEDVYIDESCRGQGYGHQLIAEILHKAQEQGCYKLIANSRIERAGVHEFYQKIGFKDYGKEFRLDF